MENRTRRYGSKAFTEIGGKKKYLFNMSNNEGLTNP
jgi:hypothetical protein